MVIAEGVLGVPGPMLGSPDMFSTSSISSSTSSGLLRPVTQPPTFDSTMRMEWTFMKKNVEDKRYEKDGLNKVQKKKRLIVSEN